MGFHHTKDIGDLGTAKAHADLVEHGFMVLFPATEHAAFDLVAYRGGTFHRVQVKYRSAQSGAISVQFRSIWADRHGSHTRPADKGEVDITCIYCPETDACYYLRPHDHGKSVTLRVTPSRNGQEQGVELAEALGVPASTLRHWDAEGLVVPGRVAGSGSRRYVPSDVRDARIVHQLRRAGYPIPTLRGLLIDLRRAGRQGEVAAGLRARRESIADRSRALLRAAVALEAVLTSAAGPVAAGSDPGTVPSGTREMLRS